MPVAPVAPPPKKNQISEPDVMGALKKDKGATKMTAQEIVQQDVEKNNAGDWKQIYAGLMEASKGDKFRIMRANNSLFCYVITGQGTGTVHVITADNPKTLIDSIKQFKDAMVKAGFKQLTATLTNPQIIKFAEAAGVKVKQQMSQQVQNGMAGPAIDVVMEV
jgi:hypothetical protein